MKLDGKTAVITGGGSGIGLAIAQAFVDEGAQVVISGRGKSRLREALATRPQATKFLAHACDVADRNSVASLFGYARDQLGEIDILVNSAGINVPKRMLADLAPEDWDRMLAIIATGSFNCTREVLPAMRRRRNGLIVNISSVSGKRAGPLGGVGYNAAKFAQTALGITTGAEAAADGVRVTNIYPGEVDTPILAQRPSPVSAEHRARILQPEDVAATVLMVACLPPRARVPELVILPTPQEYI
jgi:NAD(P)-dependent dehydrogenase (short-subunit alcohol dehydrogenase family)